MGRLLRRIWLAAGWLMLAGLVTAVSPAVTIAAEPAPAARSATNVTAVADLWADISLGPPLVSWFNAIARSEDIARIDNIDQLNMLDDITAGRRLVVFKSVADAERIVPAIAGQTEMIGYNLEHGPISPPTDQADPLGGIQRMRALADRYGLLLAFGPDRRFALSDGVAVAPYVDIFVLQIQRVQMDPAVARDFVIPLVRDLRAANPDLLIAVQIRTEGDVQELVELVDSLKEYLNGVSILTSPETVSVAEALMRELRSMPPEPPPRHSPPLDNAPPANDILPPGERSPADEPLLAEDGELAGDEALLDEPAAAPGQQLLQTTDTTFWLLVVAVALITGALVGGATAALVCSLLRRRDRAASQ